MINTGTASLTSLTSSQCIPDICHRHHRRCLCKYFLPGVIFSRLNVKTWHCVKIWHPLCNITQCIILYNVCISTQHVLIDYTHSNDLEFMTINRDNGQHSHFLRSFSLNPFVQFDNNHCGVQIFTSVSCHPVAYISLSNIGSSLHFLHFFSNIGSFLHFFKQYWSLLTFLTFL